MLDTLQIIIVFGPVYVPWLKNKQRELNRFTSHALIRHFISAWLVNTPTTTQAKQTEHFLNNLGNSPSATE